MLEKDLGSAADSQLLEAARTGNEEAFVTLFHRWNAPLYRFALHMTGSPSFAEEITQEVFMALLEDRHRYSSAAGKLAPYLFGIARNLARQKWRTRSFEPLDETESLAADPQLHDPGERLLRADEIGMVQRAVLALPPLYREVVALCDLCELSYEEAAQRIGCPVGTVRSRLHRAHSLLQKKLTRDKGDDSFACEEGYLI